MTPEAFRVTAVVAAAVTFLQMLVGSSVTGYDAGLAYTTFPSFHGALLPQVAAEPAPWLHITHRALAYTLVVLVVVLLRQARRVGDRVARRLVGVAVLLVAVQVALGAANIWWRLSPWSVVPHLAVGSWIWGTLVAVALRAHWSARAASRTTTVVDRQDAMMSS